MQAQPPVPDHSWPRDADARARARDLARAGKRLIEATRAISADKVGEAGGLSPPAVAFVGGTTRRCPASNGGGIGRAPASRKSESRRLRLLVEQQHPLRLISPLLGTSWESELSTTGGACSVRRRSDGGGRHGAIGSVERSDAAGVTA
jgi:hypothetical protein